MPDLPTITVTQAQADRMLSAWGSAANYKTWLKQMIIDYVLSQEAVVDNENFRQQQALKMAQARADLMGNSASSGLTP